MLRAAEHDAALRSKMARDDATAIFYIYFTCLDIARNERRHSL